MCDWRRRIRLFAVDGPRPRISNGEAAQVIGVDPNLGDYDNRTALHLAASNGHLESITRMLEFGYLEAWLLRGGSAWAVTALSWAELC